MRKKTFKNICGIAKKEYFCKQNHVKHFIWWTKKNKKKSLSVKKQEYNMIKKFFYKNILLSFTFLLLFFVSCKKETGCDLNNIRLKDYPEEKLVHVGPIGSDFDSALDSLKSIKNISDSTLWFKIPLEIISNCSDRSFFGISTSDCGEHSDVLDTKGQYYTRKWRPAYQF